jgi:hypothetical protein
MTTQNVRDTSFNDLIDLLCTPQLTLCISLATKKMFSGYIAYAKTLGDTDKGKDTFLKRICAWQTQCDGPNIHQSMMETRPKIIRKLFSDWNMKGKQSRGADHLHKKLLKLVSKLFLGCSNKVGKNTSEEMKKWFELMSAKQMFGDANSLKTEFEDKTRNVGGEEEELVYFDYRAVFLYTAHLVYLEWEQPYNNPPITNTGRRRDFDDVDSDDEDGEYFPDKDHLLYIISNRYFETMDNRMKVKVGEWKLKTAACIRELFPLDMSLKSETTINYDFGLIKDVQGVRQVWDRCKQDNVISIYKYQQVLCKRVLTGITHESLMNIHGPTSSNIRTLSYIDVQVQTMSDNIVNCADTIEKREKGRKHYRGRGDVVKERVPWTNIFMDDEHLGISEKFF